MTQDHGSAPLDLTVTRSAGRRRIAWRCFLLALLACQQQSCPTDPCALEFDMACGVSPPAGPYVEVSTAAGQTVFDSLRSGETVQLIASLRDSLDRPVATRGSFQWSSIDTSKAQVSETGVVSGRQLGFVEIRVRAVAENAYGGIWLKIVPALSSSVSFPRPSMQPWSAGAARRWHVRPRRASSSS